MQGNSIYPPNYDVLSDNVTGVVVAVRRNTPSLRLDGSNQMISSKPTHQIIQPVVDSTHASTDVRRASSLLRRPTLPPHVSTRFSASELMVKNAKPNTATISATEFAEILQRVIGEQRQQRRARQQRYRKKFQVKGFLLEETVAKLRDEITQLEQQRICVYTGVPTEMTPWKTVVEYFHLFRHGFEPQIISCSSSTPAESVQKKFLRHVMAPNVIFNGGYGIDALLEDWRMVTLHHNDIDIQLKSMKPESENTVVAAINGSTTITENMLRIALPQVVGDCMENGRAPIAAKLLGQRLDIPTTVRFDWDDTKMQIVRVLFHADMLTPLLKILNNLHEVSTVLDSPLNIHHWSKANMVHE